MTSARIMKRRENPVLKVPLCHLPSNLRWGMVSSMEMEERRGIVRDCSIWSDFFISETTFGLYRDGQKHKKGWSDIFYFLVEAVKSLGAQTNSK